VAERGDKLNGKKKWASRLEKACKEQKKLRTENPKRVVKKNRRGRELVSGDFGKTGENSPRPGRNMSENRGSERGTKKPSKQNGKVARPFWWGEKSDHEEGTLILNPIEGLGQAHERGG